MGFWLRATVIPLTFGSVLFMAQGLSDETTTSASPEPEPAPIVNVSAEDAESTVSSQLWSLMGDDASTCWERPEDRYGRVPASAVVKRDGTTEVKLVPASNVGSDEWVLAWCEKGI